MVLDLAQCVDVASRKTSLQQHGCLIGRIEVRVHGIANEPKLAVGLVTYADPQRLQTASAKFHAEMLLCLSVREDSDGNGDVADGRGLNALQVRIG